MGTTETILVALIFTFVIRVLLGSLIGAVLLRLACRLLGHRKSPESEQPETEVQEVPYVPVAEPVVDDPSPYRAPQVLGPAPSRKGVDKPFLTFGRAFLIMFLASLINLVLGFGLTFWAARTFTADSMFTVYAGGTLVIYAISVLYLVRFLVPTDWGRAASITMLFLGLGLILLVGLGMLLLGVGFAIGMTSSMVT